MAHSRKSEGIRRVVLHEDDVGMTHGANIAFVELSRLGVCSSGSVMVPCPWFPEAAELARENVNLDLGVHLTLTSEMVPYRWRPLTAPPRSAGLTDEAGYFWPDVGSVRKFAELEAVESELRAQIDVALASGIDVTHLDGHMGTVLMPEFTALFAKLGKSYNLPIQLVEDLHGFNPLSYAGEGVDFEAYSTAKDAARDEGQPVFDRIIETPWHHEGKAEDAYEAMFSAIPEGLTFLSLHFNAPGDFGAVMPDQAHIRESEYAFFKSQYIPAWIESYGLTVIGMRNSQG